ncbi:thioesterase-like superfamily-domain-containing protein [Sphaerosporella brunnea]|uniref:Thioesterase-like superfamily-domain-containing protein n=1 Tax=Sphaerosporella brunnea TaxID=1250544 RepID=A0A5J5F0W0_9PEZI|nr:thioesterase-like superfamily-domain-containing protein [Sphaerosporella brunnea]
MHPTAASPLSLAAAVTPAPGGQPGHYTASLQPDWCIGVVPHGGYLTTLLLNASTHFLRNRQPHAIHSALTFLTRCSVGPAELRVSPLKLGRQYSFVRVLLMQAGAVCVDATITHADMLSERGATLETRRAGPLPPRDRCVQVLPENGFRVATRKLRYLVPTERVDCAVREQWVTLDDGSAQGFGVNDLGFVADMFMPIPENYRYMKQKMHWYPTLSLALDIKALPPPGGWEWLFVRIECGTIRGGRMDVDVTICDENERIVAISRHVAIIVDAARNSVKAPAGETAKL